LARQYRLLGVANRRRRHERRSHLSSRRQSPCSSALLRLLPAPSPRASGPRDRSFYAGHPDQLAFEILGPTVIGAHERARVPQFGAAHRITAVPASVQENLKLPLTIARRDDAVRADNVQKEIARVRNLRLMAHEIPRVGKNALQFRLIDVIGKEDAPVRISAISVLTRLKVLVSCIKRAIRTRGMAHLFSCGGANSA